MASLTSDAVRRGAAELARRDDAVVLCLCGVTEAGETVSAKKAKKEKFVALLVKDKGGKQKIRLHIMKVSPPADVKLGKAVVRLDEVQHVSCGEGGDAGGENDRDVTFVCEKTAHRYCCRSIAERNELLWCLGEAHRRRLGTDLPVVGADVSSINLWAQTNGLPSRHASTLQSVRRIAAAVRYKRSMSLQSSASDDTTQNDMTSVSSALREHETSDGVASRMATSLMTEEEERDLESLLESCDLSLNDTDAFAERLQDELAALEAANVHALLASEDLVGEVIGKLGTAGEQLEQMANWLNSYDTQLEAMQRDIDEIEAKNNRLEIQTRNHHHLMSELEKLVGALDLSPEHVRALSSFELESVEGVRSVTVAAQELLRALSAELDEEAQGMRAVKEQKQEVHRISAEFVHRMEEKLDDLFARQAEVAASVGRDSEEPGNITLDDHGWCFEQFEHLMPLMSCLRSLDDAAHARACQSYARAMHLAYRKELREYMSVLRAHLSHDVHDRRMLTISDADAHASDDPSRTMALNDEVAKWIKGVTCELPAKSLSVTRVFQVAVMQILAIIEAEERFVERFFGQGRDLPGALETIFAAVHTEFQALFEYAAKHDSVQLLAIEAECKTMLDRFSEENMSFYVATFTRLQAHVAQRVNKYIDEQVAAASHAGHSAKRVGVLPAFAHAPSFVLLVETIGPRVRSVADNAYRKIMRALFMGLDTVAAADPKYSDVVIMENCHNFARRVREIPAECLQPYVADAENRFEVHASRYVEWIVESQFGKALSFVSGIEELRKTTPAEEVKFRSEFSKQAFRTTCRKLQAEVDKGFLAMRRRIIKHLSPAEGLLPLVWKRVCERFMEFYEQLEHHTKDCYEGEELPVTRDQVAAVIRDAVQHAPAPQTASA